MIMPINQAIAVTESLETVGLKWLGGIIRESALPLNCRARQLRCNDDSRIMTPNHLRPTVSGDSATAMAWFIGIITASPESPAIHPAL